MRLIYLPGLAGHPKPSPALEGLDAEIVVPTIPGLIEGETGFHPPPDYLGWLVEVWDAVDATGALPCPIVGASVGGMLAADLAILRPEAVTKLALLGPLGIFDETQPGLDPFAIAPPANLEVLFANGVPDAFATMFVDRGEAEQQVGTHLVRVAAASLLWPLGDRRLRARVHRIRQPSLLLWGEQDQIAPVGLAELWGISDVVTIAEAGHLLEWDTPDAVRDALQAFLTA